METMQLTHAVAAGEEITTDCRTTIVNPVCIPMP
jgi:hypothetical protein